ncbi:ATP-binding cassette domain-containing protein [Embleya sp. NBC_00896]|uniref:ABC transporter ATP-binding protein n=1 Tax=Embleya sp. NBC_00896 TaxID=2975961 RepID=UPI002F9142C7|nr:ATP-binding cassette domain-containing protein [Embleya sp. NBC_00896]
MIQARALTKRYGSKTAVDGLTFTVRPGVVTGFLGPNGAGKSTTMRMILGLDHPTSGGVTVNGRRYADHPAPLHEVGALLEAKAVHTGRSAYHHLLSMAATSGIPTARVREVIDLVGLDEVARKRVGGFSLGMGQRLGIATALLGDPATLVLDEPVNGLDPEGVLWIRTLLKSLAAEGRTVFLSSHLMSEMALTAEHLIVVGRGRLIADTSVADFIRGAAPDLVRVRTPDADRLRALLPAPDVRVAGRERDVLEVKGLSSDDIGRVAAAHGITLFELVPQQASLEEAFMESTRDAVEYRVSASGAAGPAGAAGAAVGIGIGIGIGACAGTSAGAGGRANGEVA